MYCTKKWGFPLRNSLVNVTKFAKNLWISSHLLKKILMDNFIFCAVVPSTSYILSIDRVQYFRRDNFWSFLLHLKVHLYSQNVTAKTSTETSAKLQVSQLVSHMCTIFPPDSYSQYICILAQFSTALQVKYSQSTDISTEVAGEGEFLKFESSRGNPPVPSDSTKENHDFNFIDFNFMMWTFLVLK